MIKIPIIWPPWGLFQKWPPLFLQSGHIFRSKVFTRFRLKVSTRLILRRFETLKVSSGPLIGSCPEKESWLLKAAKKGKAFCRCLINCYYRFLRVFWRWSWPFAAQKAPSWSSGRLGSGCFGSSWMERS